MPFARQSFLTLAGSLAAPVFLTTPASAEPETYALDNAHTHVVWTVDRFGFAKTVASFADVMGELILDEEAPENSSVSATISVASVKSDNEEREGHIRGSFWLDAEAFPSITFTSTSVTLTEDDEDGRQRAIVAGDLSVHGVTAPAEMVVTLNKIGPDPVTKKKAAGFSAEGALSRKTFGVETALGPIGETVSFYIEALAVKADE